MLAFSLYLLAGLITVAHLGSLVLLGSWGAPVHVLEYVALAGSVLMIVSAGVSLFKWPIGSRMALIGALLSWSFYLPAARQLVHAPWHVTDEAPLLFAVVSLTVLAVATACAVLSIVDIGRPHRMFGPVSARKRTALTFSMSVLLLVGTAAGVVESRRMVQRFTFIFPPDYTGWVRVDFGAHEAPPLPRMGNRYLVQVPPTGTLQTATPFDYKQASAVYEYRSAKATPATVSAGFAIAHQGGNDSTVREYLFVGSAEQHQKHVNDEPAPDGLPRPGPLAQVTGK